MAMMASFTQQIVLLAFFCFCAVRSFTPFVIPPKTSSTTVTFNRRGVVVEIELISTRHSSSTILYAVEEGSQETTKQEEDQQQQSVEPKKKEMDILNSPAFLKRKLQVLKNDISKVDEKIMKANADLEEGKAMWGEKLKELERERATVQERLREMYKNEDKLASVDVARAMLDVLDNYDRAFKNIVAETPEQEEIESSYKKTYEMIKSAFLNLGITEIETVGKEFDYAVHNAVMTSPSDEYEEGVVIQELQKGYALGDEVIRAAYVVVAC